MSPSDSSAILPAWLAGHLVGLYASVLRTQGPHTVEYGKARSALLELLQDRFARNLEWLPLSSIHLLEHAIVRPGAGQVLRALESGLLGARTRIVGEGKTVGWHNMAWTWAVHAAFSLADARRMLRLGRGLSADKRRGPEWRRLLSRGTAVESLDFELAQLRAAEADTAERSSAASRISSLLGTNLFAAQIEHALQHAIHAWPLLVIPGEANFISVSLPVGVDVAFDDGSPIRLLVSGSDALDVSGWSVHVRRAVEAAKALWRAKHGNYGDFREKVHTSSITFDFTLVDQIAQAARQAGIFETIKLVDSSAEAYLAQIVLSRLLGRTPATLSVATGSIGARLTDTLGGFSLNYAFEPPAGVDEKLRFVFDSHAFERVVLPRACRDDVGQALQAHRDQRSQSAEVMFAETLYGLADCLQVAGWRQYQYVRCPEIPWALHSSHSDDPGPPLVTTNEVSQAIDLLSKNQEAIVECALRPLAIASALAELNDRIRLRRSPVPPTLSWSFVRLIPNEQDSLFWRLLAYLCGAGPAESDAILLKTRQPEIVDALAGILNRFVPSIEHRSARAPDVVVLVGADHFNRSESLNPAARPFHVRRLLQQLQELLEPSPEGQALVGRTRIVLIGPDNDHQEPELTEGESRALKRVGRPLTLMLRDLATFDYGFTLHAAGSLLRALNRPELTDVRTQAIKPLEDAGLLRYGQGRYHIRAGLRRSLSEQLDRAPPNKRAWRRYAAGCALAPYVLQQDLVATASDQAMLPHVVSEAMHHFTASQEAQEGSIFSAAHVASRRALGWITRHLTPPSWGAALQLMRLGWEEEAYELCLDLLEMTGEERAHPAHLINAAKAAGRLAVKYRRDSTQAARGAEFACRAEQWLREAVARARADFPEERSYNELLSVVALGKHLAKHAPVHRVELDQLWSRTVELIDGGVPTKGLDLEWFELRGDMLEDHAEAVRAYGLGIQRVGAWAQGTAKALGAALISGGDQEPFAWPSDPAVCAQALDWCRKSYMRDLDSPHPWVRARWHAALELLRTSGPIDRNVLLRLQELESR